MLAVSMDCLCPVSLFQKRVVLNNLDIYALYALQIELKTDVLHTIKGN